MCGSQTTSCWRGLTFSPCGDHDGRAVGHLVLLELAALGVDDDDLAVALEGDQALAALGVLDLDGVDVAVLDRAAVDRLDVVLDQRLPVATPPVWNVRIVELRARLADRLGGDDADRQALLDDPVGATCRCRSSGRTRPRADSHVSGRADADATRA